MLFCASQVSSYSPVGYIITKVEAHDADIGSNAQLVYSMTSHDDVMPLPFDVDASNGAVYVTSSLRGRSASRPRRDYLLSVVVSDLGRPSLSSGASLVVHVNDSQSFAVAQSLLRTTSVGAGAQFGFNQKILVVLAAVTCIVAMLLVVAIVFVRCRHIAGREAVKPTPAVTLVNSTAADDAKTTNANTAMMDLIQRPPPPPQQQQQGIRHPTRTAATLPLLRVNDPLRRHTSTTPTRVSSRLPARFQTPWYKPRKPHRVLLGKHASKT